MNSVPIPVVLLTGVDAQAMTDVTVTLQFDLPDVVVVRHELDIAAQLLTRTVSDITGLVERRQIGLDHACVSCAIREDIVPTLQRLAATGRWASIVAYLPVASDVTQVLWATRIDPVATSNFGISAVLAVLDGAEVAETLLGAGLLVEQGLATSDDDDRSLAEAATAAVEFADVVVVTDGASGVDLDLIRALARPDALLAVGTTGLESAVLLGELHDHDHSEAWVGPVRRHVPHREGEVWTLDLYSDSPLHPERLLSDIERLAGGRHRSRGCFWLPSRPQEICVWDGVGGQLSIGSSGSWGTGMPFTRISVTGVGGEPDRLRAVFAELLLTEQEVSSRGLFWEVGSDGFEPWLGAIDRVA